MATTKAIIKARPEEDGLELEDVPIPEPKQGEVLLKNKAVAICGTDLHIYNWDPWSQGRVKIPTIIGHEFSSEVVKVGKGVVNVKEGDYVSGEGHLVCGMCDNCRTGNAHVCYHWKGIGYDVDGAFREYFVMPAFNIWKNDINLAPELAALQDPLGNAVHAVFRTDCVAKRVSVHGDGPVGLLAVATLKAIGAAEIFLVGWDNDYRLDIAKKLGADHVIKASEVNPFRYIREHTEGEGVDIALEMAGTPSSIDAALRSIRLAGEIVMLGIPVGKIPMDISEQVVFRSITMYGVTGRRIWDSWYRMKGLFRSGNLDLSPVLTHTFDFEDYRKGFDLMREGKCGKVVLTF